MEIIVEGKASSFLTPNEVSIKFDFYVKGSSYEEALEIGTKNVYDFIQNIILVNGFNKDDLKTRSFIIREDQIYNEVTRKYEFDGFSYNQSATLKFDFDKDFLARLMKALSTLANPPKASVYFGIKDERGCRRSILASAYEDAKEQALAIALAAGKNLKDCIKVDFKPFTTNYISRTSYDGNVRMMKAFSNSDEMFEERINSIFTPEDIEITETLYCLWLAE